MRAVISSRKHYVQHSLFTVAAAVSAKVEFINAVAPADVNTGKEIQEGDIVKAIYIEMWLKASDTSDGTFIVILEKVPAAATPIVAGQMAALDSYSNKKNILYTTMGLYNDVDSPATPIIRQWFKIPKGKQRFGLGDELTMTLLSQTGAMQGCGFGIFKSYS